MSAGPGDVPPESLSKVAPPSPPESDGQLGLRGHHYAVTIKVEGEDIPLKAFLHDLIGGAVTGLLGGLRGVPDDPQHVEIEVRRPEVPSP